MAKVKTSLTSSFNKGINFGVKDKMIEVKFDQEGFADVEDSLVDSLVEMHHTQLSKVENSKSKKAEPEITVDEALEALKAMSFEELKQMAIDAKLPKKQWEKLSEEELVSFLSKK